MKRSISLLLVFVMIMALAIPVLADKDNKVKEPNPNKPIPKEEFYSQLSDLLKEYGYKWGSTKGKGDITREEVVSVIGKYLLDEKIIPNEPNELPFKDIKNMNKDTVKILKALYGKGIIGGKTKNSFNPKSKLTYKEAKIILDRLGKLIDKEWNDKYYKTNIPFKVINTKESYQGKDGIVVKEEKDKVIVSITKEFGTPGYSMEVEKIKRINNKYEIGLSITPPKKNNDLIQVIKYITIDIEVDKKYLIYKPYNFSFKETIVTEGKIEEGKSVPFKFLDIVESYNDKEGIVVKKDDDDITVAVTKQFPTPGYRMAIEKISYENGVYKIKLLTVPPSKDSIQLQVLTYKTILLEIDEDDLGKAPYKFIIE